LGGPDILSLALGTLPGKYTHADLWKYRFVNPFGLCFHMEIQLPYQERSSSMRKTLKYWLLHAVNSNAFLLYNQFILQWHM